MLEIFKSLEVCVGGRFVGSRESENIILLLFVNFYLCLKNVVKNGEYGFVDSGFIVKF